MYTELRKLFSTSNRSKRETDQRKRNAAKSLAAASPALMAAPYAALQMDELATSKKLAKSALNDVKGLRNNKNNLINSIKSYVESGGNNKGLLLESREGLNKVNSLLNMRLSDAKSYRKLAKGSAKKAALGMAVTAGSVGLANHYKNKTIK